ncbi:hypothetical protein JAAARDRAFT_194882 [Jaapia argillacea MUCL 33604]|uniref:Uncharacterized protein n=1 Tax=Jaapia argillacea MUCL 33604 TaxID=933084 RepID=A0A067PY57_9AGAM|nr:hypothetical protein JAAARDRAFT_194882 [Jaapia argillacea MUCL 33604]
MGQIEEADIDLVISLCIREIHWAKQPGFPSHEYLIIKLVDARRVIHDTILRVERDTDSWASLLSLGSRTKCLDTITISSSEASLRGEDTILASIYFKSYAVDVWYLVRILGSITAEADTYNIYTFNCWWFASRIWTNLAKCAHPDSLYFQLQDGIHENQALLDLIRSRHHCNAVEFARVLNLLHLAFLGRLHRSPAVRGELAKLEQSTAKVDESFQKYRQNLLELELEQRQERERRRSLSRIEPGPGWGADQENEGRRLLNSAREQQMLQEQSQEEERLRDWDQFKPLRDVREGILHISLIQSFDADHRSPTREEVAREDLASLEVQLARHLISVERQGAAALVMWACLTEMSKHLPSGTTDGPTDEKLRWLRDRLANQEMKVWGLQNKVQLRILNEERKSLPWDCTSEDFPRWTVLSHYLALLARQREARSLLIQGQLKLRTSDIGGVSLMIVQSEERIALVERQLEERLDFLEPHGYL